MALDEAIGVGSVASRDQEQQSAAEELTWVMADIASLSDIDREICEMCLIDGLTYKEAALTVGLRTADVEKRLERSRGRLRALRQARERDNGS